MQENLEKNVMIIVIYVELNYFYIYMNIEKLIDYKKEYNKFRRTNIELRNDLMKRDEKIIELKGKIKKLKQQRYNYYCSYII